MQKIVLINGPAGSGKDTAALLLKEEFSGEIVKFATPLKDAATAIYCGNNRNLFNQFDTYEKKGIPDPQFMGLSCRQAQINISEEFLKKQHGEEVFGQMLKNKISNWLKLGVQGPFFVSDSGFVPEAEVLVKAFGRENVILIRLRREGHTFDGDSRGYVYLDHLGVNSYEISNEGTLEELKEKLIDIIKGEQNYYE